MRNTRARADDKVKPLCKMRFVEIRGTRGMWARPDMLIQLFLSCRQPPKWTKPFWTIFFSYLWSTFSWPTIKILFRYALNHHHGFALSWGMIHRLSRWILFLVWMYRVVQSGRDFGKNKEEKNYNTFWYGILIFWYRKYLMICIIYIKMGV